MVEMDHLLGVMGYAASIVASDNTAVKEVAFIGRYEGYDLDADGDTNEWNVIGRNNYFPGGRNASIATLGGQPLGTPGAIVDGRTWDDYKVNRALTQDHLSALDQVYVGVVEDHRKAIKISGDIDPVSEDMLIGQTNQLELFHWFVRAHLEDKSGNINS